MDTKIKKQAAPSKRLEAVAKPDGVALEHSDYTPNNSKYKIYDALLGNQISVHRVFRTIAGDWDSAIFLSVAYNDLTNWKSGDEWQELTGLTRAELEAVLKKLDLLGLMEMSERHAYRVNRQKLFELIGEA